MEDSLRKRLVFLADKYEVRSFSDGDPSQFLRWYNPISCTADAEAAAFIAAMLSFGSRSQFIPKIRGILGLADAHGGIARWLRNGFYKAEFCPDGYSGQEKFYRFYSYSDMLVFFDELAFILCSRPAMGDFFREKWMERTETGLCDVIAAAFPRARLVPKGRNSANKRIHMFLRWMVRTGSPVDLGLWTWYPAEELLIPLDVHVMQQARELGLLPPRAAASRRTAVLLTQELREAFPGDPARADYALFGLGVAGLAP